MGSAPGRPAKSVSDRDAQDFLGAHLGRDVGAVTLIGEGAWSRCFGFTDRGRKLVIRFGRYRDDFENDRRASAFASAALPVPEVLEIGPAFDGHFAISTRAHGEPLESLSPVAWQATLPALLAALDAIRGIDLSGTRGFGGWDATGNAPYASWRDFLLAVDADTPDRRTHGWRQRLRAAPGGDETFARGHARLAGLAEAGAAERHLLHSDLINRNVLVQGSRITGVFDWGCSLYGDFLYDVAWLEFWAPWHAGIAACDVRSAAARHWAEIGLEVPDLAARMCACLVHIGLDHLAYTAYTGDLDALSQVTKRLAPLIEGSA